MPTFNKSYLVKCPLETAFAHWVAEDTEVEVTHAGFQSTESHDMHASGWDNYLAGFEAHVGKAC
jgi:hypothetical protein